MTRRRSTRFRVAVALVGVAGLLFAFVFPTRAWWDQRQDLDVERDRVELLRSEADELQRELERLRDDEEVERLARERLNLVHPGETAWAIVPGPQAPAEVPTEAPADPG